MTRAHDRQKTLPQRRCTSVVRVDAQRLVHAQHPHLPPLRPRLRLYLSYLILCRLPREAVQRLAAALVRAHHQA
jgi:hypothetical protein